MLKEPSKYIQFDIIQYLQEAGEITRDNLKFENIRVVEMILPSVFLKMTGCIEHKLDMIWLQICLDDEKKRQEMMRKNSSIPSGSGEVTNILNKLNECYKEFDIEYDDVWKQYEALEEVANKLKETLSDTGISNYLGEKFILFSRFIDSQKYICDILAKMSQMNTAMSIQEKICLFEKFYLSKTKKYIIKKHIDNFIQITTEYLKNESTSKDDKAKIQSLKEEVKNCDIRNIKNMFNEAIMYRNMFAHNEYSVYRDTPTPSKLANDENIFTSWPFRFLAILYIDTIIRDRFKKYTDIKKKYFLFAR
jgi:hypothetical protein